MTDTHTPETPIQRAVRVAGGQSALAQQLQDLGEKVTPQAVQQWVANGQVSHKRAVVVAKVTGIPLHELRPDLYPAPAEQTGLVAQH